MTDIVWETTDVETAALAGTGARLVLAERGDEEELLTLVPRADAILTCFAEVSAAVVAAGKRLQVIGRYGVGTDNIAVDEATSREILVTNVPVYCLDEVVEHVLGLLLCMVRGIHRYDSAVRRGEWSLAPGLPIRRVAGRTIGVLGFGAIGRHLAQRARALGLHVVAHDHNPDDVVAAGFEAVGLNELAERSDFVSLHLPLTDETRGLIDERFLEAMGPRAYLVNCARGAIVDHVALTHALERGVIAGAAMDVFEPERLPSAHALLGQPNLLATPHTAFYSEESMRDLARLAAENVAAVLRGRRPPATVNSELLRLPRWAHLAP